MNRRQLAGASGAALLAGLIGPGKANAAGADVDLVQACRRFAETEFTCWYRYVTAPEDVADSLPWPTDWDALYWITATPATTLDGLRAKALAFCAWNPEAFDDPEDERDKCTPLLASLLRDLARQDRDAIIARLAQEYGSLPEGYTTNGMWLGKVNPAPAPVAYVRPDADLIAACRAMIEAQQTYNAIYDGPHAIEDDEVAGLLAAPIVRRWNDLLDDLERLHATTAIGIAARAQALAFHAKEGAFSFDGEGTMTARMLRYLLRDAAAAGLPAGVAT